MKSWLLFCAVGMITAQSHAVTSRTSQVTEPFAYGVENHLAAGLNSYKTAGMAETALQLIPMLTEGLGVSQSQAQGGMGAILQAVKSLLSGTDYSTLLKAIPNASKLLDSAPEVLKDKSKGGSLLDSALKMTGESSDKVSAGTQLMDQFDSLGLDKGMISKYAGVAQNYLTKSDKGEASDILRSAMSKLF